MKTQYYDNESPDYHVRHWRNVPKETEDTLEDFLAWLEYDDESPNIGEVTLREVKALVDAYLGRNMKKVRQGEKELLAKWMQNVKE